MVAYSEVISLTTPRGRCCSNGYFRLGGKPELTTFRIAFANGICQLAGQLVRFVIKDQSWTTF